jgi:diguanylate cyclase (GGDEF)-like protein
VLQNQGKTAEAIEQYVASSELLLARGRREQALDCLERVAQLEPENAARQFAAGHLAEELGRNPLAVRAYLRAAQLSEAGGKLSEAIELLARAHALAPGERSPALLYAQALLRHGDAAAALALLEPHAPAATDSAFLISLGDAYAGTGRLDQARKVFEGLGAQEPSILAKLFDLAGRYLAGKQDNGAVDLLRALQKSAVKAGKEGDFAARLDALAEPYAQSAALTEFCVAAYSDLNRETRYFGALVRLFDLVLEGGDVGRAADALDKLVEIDPYDFGNQSRIERLEGRADPIMLSRIRARLAQVGVHTAKPAGTAQVAQGATREESGGEQTLEDLIVQAEIFMQYSLHAKAVERLERIAELFPGEEENNERLRDLCRLANWWPPGAAGEKMRANAEASNGAASARPPVPAPESVDTMRDLSKIAEIGQMLHRQPSTRAIVSTAIQEAGNYLRATRCIAVLGAPGRPPQTASEFCASGVVSAPGALLVRLLGQMEGAPQNGLGGMQLDPKSAPVLSELGLEAALGVPLSDPETQAQAGMIVAGYATAHAWRPHETYFLQAVGSQMLLSVNHTRLRNMARTLGAADEKTGLLTRSSYLDCLIQETQRAKSSGSTLALAVFQVDRGADLLRQYGEAQMERYLEQLVRAIEPVTRQSDLAVRYTSWAIAFILPDTTLAGAQVQAEKLRNAATTVRPPWDGAPLALSASVCEAAARLDYDSEDIVTEMINRAEAGLNEARRRGGVVANPLVS